jgi:hypothetical protein
MGRRRTHKNAYTHAILSQQSLSSALPTKAKWQSTKAKCETKPKWQSLVCTREEDEEEDEEELRRKRRTVEPSLLLSLSLYFFLCRIVVSVIRFYCSES